MANWFNPDDILQANMALGFNPSVHGVRPIMPDPVVGPFDMPAPGTAELRRGPFTGASGPNAPSGIPPEGIVPVIDVARPDPVIPGAPIVPEKTQDEKLAEALKLVGHDLSTVTPKATKAEKAAVAERVELSQEAIGTAIMKGIEEREKASELAAQAEKEKADALAFAAEAEARKQAAEAEFKARSADLDAKRAEYEQNGTIRDMFGGDSAKRVQANLMTGIGAFASARGSGIPNLAGQNLANELKQWQTMEVSRIAKDENLFKMAREDRQKALAEVELQVNNKAAAMAGVMAKERANILASHGVNEAQIKTDETINKIKDTREEFLQRNQEGLRSVTTASNASQQDIKEKIAGAKIDEATGKLPPGKKQANETVTALASINSGINDVDRVKEIIEKNPKALEEYQAAHQKWNNLQKIENSGFIGKTGIAGARLLTNGTSRQIPTSEEQMMPNKEALELHTLMSNITTGIAKSYGGVITDSDRNSAGSRVAILATGDPGAVRKTFDDIGTEFKNKRSLYVQNTGAEVPLTDTEKKQRNAQIMERLRRNPMDVQAREELKQLSTAMAR